MSASFYYSHSKVVQEVTFLDLISKVNIKLGDSCLDIGCGPGNNTKILSNHVGRTGLVIGIDSDRERINHAQKAHADVENLAFKCMKSIEVPLELKKFDLVCSNAVMHWMSDADKLITIGKVFDILRPGGIFAINANLNVPPNILRLLSLVDDTNVKRDKIDLEFSSKAGYKSMLTSTGFDVISIDEINYDFPFTNLDVYLEWIRASGDIHLDLKTLYEDNSNQVELDKYEDGKTIKHYALCLNVIARKPISKDL
ncbi:trans-aconitate 2-methyltransferase-like [Hydractinia symbiolongicarpus]|uniref:trans-aconitate 2-methyltransferase-like n=1 Tax=Hydractinia symbiolongicarpus TaxID=13093 RepID=UPI0025505393|nr:trans-aconitate 2-methyltransferase-like [Hydractinia symbiolongicarpus]